MTLARACKTLTVRMQAETPVSKLQKVCRKLRSSYQAFPMYDKALAPLLLLHRPRGRLTQTTGHDHSKHKRRRCRTAHLPLCSRALARPSQSALLVPERDTGNLAINNVWLPELASDQGSALIDSGGAREECDLERNYAKGERKERRRNREKKFPIDGSCKRHLLQSNRRKL